MQRFYVNYLDLGELNLFLEEPWLVHQLVKVLRSKNWDKISLFNWTEKKDYIYKIVNIEKRWIFIEFLESVDLDSEITYYFTLFQSIPNKLDKIEYIIQKWVEAWFTSFNFFRSNRSQELRGLTDSKIDRFRKIIIEAVEQSGRSVIPDLNFIKAIDFEWIKVNKNIFFHTNNSNSILLKDLNIKSGSDINLFVWPEWWFEDTEIDEFEKNNFTRVHLWDRILRTETTWVVTWFYIIQNK